METPAPVSDGHGQGLAVSLATPGLGWSLFTDSLGI